MVMGTDPQSASKKMKALSVTPILADYGASLTPVARCDSSQSDTGEVVLQDGRPTDYPGHHFILGKKNHAQIRKETCNTVRFHGYTYDRRTVVHTDHKRFMTVAWKPLRESFTNNVGQTSEV